MVVAPLADLKFGVYDSYPSKERVIAQKCLFSLICMMFLLK